MKLTPGLLRLMPIFSANAVSISKPPLPSCFPSAGLESCVCFAGNAKIKDFPQRRQFLDVRPFNDLLDGLFLNVLTYGAVGSDTGSGKIVDTAGDAFINFQDRRVNRPKAGAIVPQIKGPFGRGTGEFFYQQRIGFQERVTQDDASLDLYEIFSLGKR